MKILNSRQLAAAEKFTISNEPVSSIDLMERAAKNIFDLVVSEFKTCNSYTVFCGPGNNGGDGLVLARRFKMLNKTVDVVLLKGNNTNEFNVNFEKIKSLAIPYIFIGKEEDVDNLTIPPGSIVIDALFGNGINRPVSGLASKLIQKINSCNNYKIAIDLPSGLSPDMSFKSNEKNTVKADLTYTIQLPKLAFMFAESGSFSGRFQCVDIGLSKSFINTQPSKHIYLDNETVKGLIKPRAPFGHKGTFGHVLIIAGSEGKNGAAILSSKAALKSGCGLLTALIPAQAEIGMNSILPEAMVLHQTHYSGKSDYSKFDAIGFGPGIGPDKLACDSLLNLLKNYKGPLVIDADGLNCLSKNQEWFSYLNPNIILTPHPGEFDRLTHKHETPYERFITQQLFSAKHNVIVVLKGRHTSITTPSGLTYFNSTGNSGMATAGSGDVLTGIITSLCAQGYSTENAATLGVYLHGYAGDTAAAKYSKTSMIATDIINEIGSFFKDFES